MENPLESWIRREIGAAGPVPFERFMEWVLYHPEQGYYAAGRANPGRDEGDFTTAPQISRLFGRCFARLLQAADEALGRPSPFHLVEGGAGEGRLGRDILDAVLECGSGLYERLVYVPEESGAVWEEPQERMLGSHGPRLSRSAPPDFEGVYVSNELLDAFPVHRLTRRGREILEIHVGAAEDGFAEVLLPPSRPELMEYLSAEGIEVCDGCEVEVSLGVLSWMAGVAARLRRGYVVTVDYGDESGRLYGPQRPRGTCVAYRKHRLSRDLLSEPGRRDLTAHVNFSALLRAGRGAGLEAGPLLKQRDFLFALGLLAEVEAMEDHGLSEVELIQARRALAPLIFPGDGMGEAFKVLVQAKNAPLAGLRLDPSAPLPCT